MLSHYEEADSEIKKPSKMLNSILAQRWRVLDDEDDSDLDKTNKQNDLYQRVDSDDSD